MGQRLIAFVLALCCFGAWAQNVRTFIPKGAHTYAPELVKVQKGIWDDVEEPFTLAGQIEQESCISLTHSKCWNPKAELKTSREYGFGLGQVTVAYRPNGEVRFNKFEELRVQYESLRNWNWGDRYRVDYQLQAIVEMDKALYRYYADAATLRDRWAFTLAAYNGGRGGIAQDRLLCSNTKGCNPRIWFGHVEHTSLKTRRVNPGYRKSAFEINREYPQLILDLRRDKYKIYWQGEK